jgi:hypothetical protein
MRHLARCDGTLIPPPNIPTCDDDGVSSLVEARIIPGLMSGGGGLFSAKASSGLQSALINRAIVNNLRSFAKDAPLTSAVLGSFLATFEDMDPLMDGPALDDDE